MLCNTDKTVVCGVCMLKLHKGHDLPYLKFGTDARGVEDRAATARCAAGTDVMVNGVKVATDVITALAVSKTATMEAFNKDVDKIVLRLVTVD